jgi:site-specific DNA-methyltransferase (cytosine-N4-specific)
MFAKNIPRGIIFNVVESGAIPFGAQFSPNQIDLKYLLELCSIHSGDCVGLQAAIRHTWFSAHSDPETSALNTRLGLRDYGLIDDQCKPSDLARNLLEVKTEAELYAVFGAHILNFLSGNEVLDVVRSIQSRGQRVTLVALEDDLINRELKVASASSSLSSLRLWLEKAGVILNDRWQIDEEAYAKIAGFQIEDFEILKGLDARQKAFALALLSTGETSWQDSRAIADLAEAREGLRIHTKILAPQIVIPLQSAALIEYSKSTTSRGGGRIAHAVRPTAKLLSIADALARDAATWDPPLRKALRRPLADIVNELGSENKNVKGLALEALAVRILRIIGLERIQLRQRAAKTGGAEVDVLAEGRRLIYSRWQVQCKNTPVVELADVAKEVGVAVGSLKSSVILVITMGRISSEAKRYAADAVRNTNLHIAFLTQNDIVAIGIEPSSVISALNREANGIFNLKKDA